LIEETAAQNDLDMIRRIIKKLYGKALGNRRNAWRWPSETSKCRERLAPYCKGYGLDLGFGGDPITLNAIRVDLPSPYTEVGESPVQLGGDASRLVWFKDECLDFIYSSHLLEDYIETELILREWLRVIKPGGCLVIFCPDEQVYRKHCQATGQPYNVAHKHADFSLEFVKAILKKIGQTRDVHEVPLIDGYSWELVSKKYE
jgi:predicted SAM-dependent methyltransferase